MSICLIVRRIVSPAKPVSKTHIVRGAGHAALVVLFLGFLSLCSCGTSSGTGEAASRSDAGESDAVGESHDDLVVFTTKAAFSGNLGGLSGADEKCNTYAKAAGLNGVFRAWLSDSSTDALSRVPTGGPWRVLDKSGRQASIAFADRDAWSGYPQVRLENTEFGKTLSDFSAGGTTSIPYTWTGTKLGGTKIGCHCTDWSSSANFVTCADKDAYGGVIGSRGAAPSSDEAWTDLTSNPCDAPSSLLCFQLP